MVKVKYNWANNELLPHTSKKLIVLRDYFSDYLRIRCKNPNVGSFKILIIDGFAGGGKYKCGTYGSPLIFLDVLDKISKEINFKRQIEGLKKINFECQLILNDNEYDVIEILKENIAPVIAFIKTENPYLQIEIEFENMEFEKFYLNSHERLKSLNYKNVLFNLDQCGNSLVNINTLKDIMYSFNSAEIFWTFMVDTYLKYLPLSDKERLKKSLNKFDIKIDTNFENFDDFVSKKNWLGIAEKEIWNAFKSLANFVTPFAIQNPEGYKYWLIHLSKVSIARKAYNDILHNNSSNQVHYGNAGLNMLSYNPDFDHPILYNFDDISKEASLNALYDDIPRFLGEQKDPISIGDFYNRIFNETPASTNEIHRAIFENQDIEIKTPNDGARKKHDTIQKGDIISLKPQMSFYFKK